MEDTTNEEDIRQDPFCNRKIVLCVCPPPEPSHGPRSAVLLNHISLGATSDSQRSLFLDFFF